jgi:5-methylcytosine-specific restriction enzyme A
VSRKEFPKRVQRDAFVRANGHCEGCHAKLTLHKYQYDHVNPDGLTGEPTLENCMVLCSPCHLEKTRKDVAAIAQAKRRADRHMGITDPHTSKLRTRGFSPAPKQSSATRPLAKWFGPSLQKAR